MKEHFEKRIDNTRQAYLEALDRLKKGQPTHKDLVDKPIKINATTIALEAGKSRNPLYHTHKDILDMIIDTKKSAVIKKEVSENDKLKERIKYLEEENKRLLNVNATLLFKIK